MKNKIWVSLSVVILICMIALASLSLLFASNDAIYGDTTPAVLTSITVSPVNPLVVSGQTEQFTAQGLDQDGNVMTGVVFIWDIASSQSDAGTINSSTGVFTAGTIYGTYTNAIEAKSGNVTGSVSVTVILDYLNITTVSLADGQVGVDYSQTLEATGGIPPYTWSITNGSLPDGLSLTGDIISGTPTAAGSFNFTVAVTDNTSPTHDSVTGDLSITISPATPTGTTAFIVRLVSGLSAASQQQVIARNGGVETSAVPVLKMHFIKVPNASINEVVQRYQSDPNVRSIEYDTVCTLGETPSDPSYPDQWALPKISWDSVFGSVTPTGSSVIAILDTGIDASHPDLSGLVLSGYSAFTGSDARTDPNGHGTKMAGITAARTNNNIGVAGVAYAGVSLLPIQVLAADGTGQDSDVINGIVWAIDHGANVILMAFSNPDYSLALQEAIDYAWDNGVILVAAAGNEGANTLTYPAGDRCVIGVSATDPNDALFPSSNYGQIIFLAAPGVNLLTTSLNGGYTTVSGTSAAAAMVAGAAAFMHAVDPGLSNGVIVGRLARTADPAGTQEQTGNGRLNMARALSDTSTTPIEPTGAAPVGDGGPYIGPYLAAAAISSTAAGGNWNDNATWVGGVVPGSGDTVTIVSGATVTVDIAAECNTLTFTAATSSSVVISGTNSLSVTGLISMPRPSTGATCTINVGAGTLSAGSLTMSATTGSTRVDTISISTGSATISGTVTTSGVACRFTFTDAGTLTFGGTMTLTGAPTLTTVAGSTVIYSRAGAQTAIQGTYNNLTLAGSGAKTITGVTVNGVLSMEETATASAAPTYGAAATLQYNTDTARNAGAEWITPFAATGGVIIANTGTITLNAAKVFNASVPLTINEGATLATANLQLTLGGNFVNNGGTFTAGSSAIVIAYTMANQSIDGFTTTGTVSMTKTGGTANFTGNVNGGALTINGVGGTLNLGNGLTHTFTGAWTRTNGTLDGGSSTLRIGGNVSGTGGTFTAGTGTVEYYGGAQTCASYLITYNNLTLSGSGAKSFGNAMTINGILSIEGTATGTFTGITYGASATLQYKTTNTRTAGATEWPNTFAATGGVIIANTAGSITLNAAKVFNASVPLTINEGATLATANLQLTLGGNFVNNGGTFTAGSSAIVIASTMANQSIDGFTTTGIVSMTKTAGTANFTGDVNGGALTINGLNGTLNLGNGLTHTFTGAWTRTNGTLDGGSSTLRIGGNVSGSGGTFTASTGTVEWYAAGAQTVAGVAYNNLTLSGSGAKTMTGVTTIGGDLTISGSATMTGNAGFTVTGALNYGSSGTTTLTASTPISIGKYNQTAGTLVDNGNTITVTGTGADTWTKSGGTFTATGTATFTGAAPQIGASNFRNFTINVGSGNTATLTGAITVSGTLTISSNTTLADGGSVVTANGNVANSGTHSGAGEIYLAGGAASHSLSGSGIYGNLELNDSNGASLTASPTINGELTLTSGALSIGANTLTLNGEVSTTSGSLTGGASSNIIFGGSGDSTTLPVVTLNNLTINRASGISIGGAVIVGGTLTLTSGMFTINANTLTLNGPTIAGTPSNLDTDSSSSLSFGGSSAGVNIPSNVTALNNLTINNSNGITLNSNLTIYGTLTLTSGNLLAGSNTVIIPAGGTVSRTSGHVIGNLQKNVALGATSRTFEVGTASAYNPVTVVFGNVTTAGDLIVKATSGQHPNIGTCIINSSKDVNEYWSLTNSDIVFNSCNVTFNFVAGDILGGANPSNFIVGQYSSVWTYPNVGTKTATSTQTTGITSFGDFCVGEMIIPPTVNSVTLVDASMTPQVEYTVTVNVSNVDAMSILDTLVLKLWYDSSGSDHSESTFDGMTADPQECAIITWTQLTDSFVIEPSSSTTWALGACSSPGSLPGNFIFRFTAGKVATATSGSARWQVAAKASNNVGQTGFNYDSTPPTMNWYGEITINTVNINWTSTIALGSGFTDNTTNRITGISLTYICNGNYNIRVKASSLWSGSGKSITLVDNVNPGYGEFALRADDDDTLNDAVLVLSTGYTTFSTGTQTSESGNTITSNSLWLKLGASGIPDVELSGTIYYEITPG